MSKEDLFEFHPLIKKLESLEDLAEIRVLKANFKTGNITITFNEDCKNFSDVIKRLKFCEMHNRLVIQSADFEAGHIVVQMLDHDKNQDLTDEEFEFMKQNRKLMTIKAVRSRTGMGLADAKKFVEKAWDKIKASQQ